MAVVGSCHCPSAACLSSVSSFCPLSLLLSDSVSGVFVSLRKQEITEGMGETIVAFEAPCTDGESRDMADDATVFAAPVDGGARRGAGEAAAEA